MKVFTELQKRHEEFIRAQKMFFVGTAPLAENGHINVSPKGYDSFAILSSHSVAYIDLGGSGIETHAHAEENGRICFMFCSFDDKPLILRLYGSASAHVYGSQKFLELRKAFSHVEVPVRGIIQVQLTRVQDSCGWGVPRYKFLGERERLRENVGRLSQEEHIQKRMEKNRVSIDGLPGLERPAE